MTVMSVAHGSGLALSASLIYGISLIVLYTMSTVYHAVANPKAKEILRIFDHTSIFLFNCGELYAVLSGGPRRKQQGTCGNHRSMGLCNSGHRAQRHRSEKRQRSLVRYSMSSWDGRFWLCSRTSSMFCRHRHSGCFSSAASAIQAVWYFTP